VSKLTENVYIKFLLGSTQISLENFNFGSYLANITPSLRDIQVKLHHFLKLLILQILVYNFKYR